MQHFPNITPWPRSLLIPFGIILGLVMCLIISLTSDKIGSIVLLEVGLPLLGSSMIWIGKHFIGRIDQKRAKLLCVLLIIFGVSILSFGLIHIAWFLNGMD